MTAEGAQSVEFEAVGLNGKAIPAGDFFLKPFNIAVFEFDDLPTAGADQMVVMTFVRDVIVLGLGTKVSSLGEAGLTEEVERTIDGRQSEMGILPSELVVKLFCSNVFLLEKGIEDEFPLARVFQLVLPKMFLENSHFFGVF